MPTNNQNKAAERSLAEVERELLEIVNTIHDILPMLHEGEAKNIAIKIKNGVQRVYQEVYNQRKTRKVK